MNRELLSKLKQGPLPPVVLVHGKETYWRDQVFSVLKERNGQDSFGEWNWSVLYGAKELSLDAIIAELATLPWGNGTRIVVLKDAHLVPVDVLGKLTQWLEENPQGSCLALFFDRVEESWKFLKALRQMAWEVKCDPLEGAELARYIASYCKEVGKEMTKEAVALFLERVADDLLVVNNELEKLVALAGDKKAITAADVEAITSLWPDRLESNAVFQLTDCIAQQKRQEALAVLERLLSSGQPPLRILSLIDRQLRLLLAAKTAGNNLEVAAREMGETSPYPLRKLRAQAGLFSLEELLAGFRAVIQADGEMKLGVAGEEALTDLVIRLT